MGNNELPGSAESTQSRPVTRSRSKRSKYFINVPKSTSFLKGESCDIENPGAKLKGERKVAQKKLRKFASESLASPRKRKCSEKEAKAEVENNASDVKSEQIGTLLKTPTKSRKYASPNPPKSPSKAKLSSPRKRIKIEPGSLTPPENWERIYSLVEELRSDRSAPVDTEGGHELPEKHLGEVVYRFQVLIALMLSSQTKDAVVGETMRILQKVGLKYQRLMIIIAISLLYKYCWLNVFPLSFPMCF